MCQSPKWHKGGCGSPQSLIYYIHTKQPHQMRKIETLMNAAITNGRNFSSGNTTVTHEDGVAIVTLHGNKIAEVGDGFVTLFDGGWQSNTTKSRLNAILQVHGIRGEGVFQRNFKWFVHKFVGQAGTSPVFVEKEFESGMVLA